MNNFIDRLLSLISPHICKECGQLGSPLCKSCFFNIVENGYVNCVYCGADLDDKTLFLSGNLCRNCAKNSPFSQVFVVSERTGALKKLVGDFKFLSERENYRALANLLNSIVPDLQNDVLITTVPTARPHIRARGFDHAELIARAFAKKRGLKYQPLTKRLNNQSQHALDADERRRLAAKTYAVRDLFKGKIPAKILLIDDIWTTGATSDAMARLLRKNGAKNVALAIVARQPTDGAHGKIKQ